MKPLTWLGLLALTALFGTTGIRCLRHQPTATIPRSAAPVLHKTMRPNEGPKTVRRVSVPPHKKPGTPAYANAAKRGPSRFAAHTSPQLKG